jgi:hypothetical protein
MVLRCWGFHKNVSRETFSGAANIELIAADTQSQLSRFHGFRTGKCLILFVYSAKTFHVKRFGIKVQENRTRTVFRLGIHNETEQTRSFTNGWIIFPSPVGRGLKVRDLVQRAELGCRVPRHWLFASPALLRERPRRRRG